MKISLEWLSDYVDVGSLDVRRLVNDLTMKTVEVESAISLEERVGHVVVGEVVSVESKGTDGAWRSLVKCVIADGGSVEVEVATFVPPVGMSLALALPRAKPYRRDKAFNEGHVSGVTVTSNSARICSAADLGLETLFPLDPQAPLDLTSLSPEPGALVADLLNWKDTILVIDNKSLTNRPDLWGHYGIAREIAAIYELRLQPLPKSPILRSAAASLVREVDPAICDRLTLTQIIREDVVLPSPMWLRSRLARVDQRAINMYVDLSNYVMYAVGQPAHVYDAASVHLPLSVVRASSPFHSELLDGSNRSFGADVPVVSDLMRPRAIAGVVGDASSSVTAATKSVLLEIATFKPGVVRRSAQDVSIRTEASSRFEKGLDTQRCELARNLFLHLVSQLDPAARPAHWQDVSNSATTPTRLELPLRFLRERIGEELSTSVIVRELALLGFQCELEHDTLEVIAPTWRSTGDVSLPHDLVEEVARLSGYEAFAGEGPKITLKVPAVRPIGWLARRVREHLALRAGMQEVITYPWVGDRYLKAARFSKVDTVTLERPPSPDRNSLRPSLVPNLLEVVGDNARRIMPLRVFEVGTIFLPVPYKSLRDHDGDRPAEYQAVTGAFVGEDVVALFRAAKGAVDGLRRSSPLCSVDAPSMAAGPWADPSASSAVGTGDDVVGTIGRVRDDVLLAAGIRELVVVCFDLRLDLIVPYGTRENQYTSRSEYPEVTFDISFIVPERVPWSNVVAALNGSSEVLRGVSFVDQFKGHSIPAGTKSLTARFTLGANDHTLTSSEIADVRAELIQQLTGRVNARIRRKGTAEAG